MYGNKVGNVDLAGSMGVENGIECPSEAIGFSGGAMKITAKLYSTFWHGRYRKEKLEHRAISVCNYRWQYRKV
jgi:hypothetical protein